MYPQRVQKLLFECLSWRGRPLHVNSGVLICGIITYKLYNEAPAITYKYSQQLVYVHIYIYQIITSQHIYIWLAPVHLPTFLGSKPIYHPCLAQKKAFFLHKFVRKKNRVLTLHMKKRPLAPISQRFLKNKPRNPLFYSVLAQNVTLPLVMLIMSLMFWVSVSKKCLKRW